MDHVHISIGADNFGLAYIDYQLHVDTFQEGDIAIGVKCSPLCAALARRGEWTVFV